MLQGTTAYILKQKQIDKPKWNRHIAPPSLKNSYDAQETQIKSKRKIKIDEKKCMFKMEKKIFVYLNFKSQE